LKLITDDPIESLLYQMGETKGWQIYQSSSATEINHTCCDLL
jgi:hypothetical protein